MKHAPIEGCDGRRTSRLDHPGRLHRKVDDAVGVVRLLAPDEARYVNGANVHLSGGWGL